MEDLTGKQFGPYQIVAPLGEGGMATVYKAYQPAMERYVALKVLPRHFSDDPQFTTRFQQEARILAQLQHSHILPVHDSGQSEGYAYIVMPFVQGGTLTDLLKGQPLPLPLVSKIITQVGGALMYAHARGLIHRDIKPSNVLMDESGNCLLADFGLARIVEASMNLTASGAIMGTPAYMSPEQGSGQKVDARSDVYSLGVILYELVTGRVPYKAETPVAVIFKHIQDPLPSARKLNPELPEALERVILKALSKNPEDRYQTAAEMVKALQTALSDVPLVAPTRTSTLKRMLRVVKAVNRPWVYRMLGVVALAMLGIFFGPRAWEAVSTTIANRPDVATKAPVSTASTNTQETSAESNATESAPSKTMEGMNLSTTSSSTPSFTPTSAAPSLAQVAEEFAGPILAAIEDREPDFQDDFNQGQRYDWRFSSDDIKGKLEIANGVLTVHVDNPHGGHVGNDMLRFDNFVLEVDIDLTDLGNGDVSVDAMNENHNIAFGFLGNPSSFENGWDVSRFTPTSSTPLSGGETTYSGINSVIIISYERQYAVYINEKPRTYIYDTGQSPGKYSKEIYFMHNPRSDLESTVRFDNLKIWNLDEVDLSTTIRPPTPEPATAFYNPILAYIDSEPPTFEDDFSTQKIEWGKSTHGERWITTAGTRDGVFQMSRTLPLSPYAYLLSSNNFAISVDWALTEGRSITFVFRSQTDETKYYKYEYIRGGEWEFSRNRGYGDARLRYGSFQPVPGSESKWPTNEAGDKWISTPLNNFVFIAQGENLAVYVNGDLVLAFDELEPYGDWNFFQATGGQNITGEDIMMDNFKFWNLDGVEFNP